VTWAGVALLTAGLVMLGYVGWQLYGTNYVARQQQAEAVEEVRRTWAQTSAEQATEVGDGPEGAATALIRVPRFGRDYVMPVLEGTSDEVLATGFGRFDHAAGPGERGNYALAAHRVTHGEPLRDMPRLRPGDLVEVETRSQVFVYRLTSDPNDLVVTFEDTWVVDRRPDNPEQGGVEPPRHPRLITLTTCAEIFHTDDRMIVFGHLVQTRDKADPRA
jgi:sortase A